MEYKNNYTYEELRKMSSDEIMDKMCYRLNEKLGRSLFTDEEMTKDLQAKIVDALSDFTIIKDNDGNEYEDRIAFISSLTFGDLIHGRKGPNGKVADMYQLMKVIDNFNKVRDWDQFHSPDNLAKSISIEAAELLECFQWNDDKFDLNEIKEEIADVMNYCLQLCTKLNLDPKQLILDKLEVTGKKYPIEKCKGVSTKYNKL